MTYYLNLDTKEVKRLLEKKTRELELKNAMLNQALPAIAKVSHYKQITKRLTNAIKEAGVYSYLDQRYTQSIKLYLDQAVRSFPTPADKNGNTGTEYYDETDEVIYFDTVAELIENIQKRIDHNTQTIEQLKRELDNLPGLLSTIDEATKTVNRLEECMSYTLKKAIKL